MAFASTETAVHTSSLTGESLGLRPGVTYIGPPRLARGTASALEGSEVTENGVVR